MLRFLAAGLLAFGDQLAKRRVEEKLDDKTEIPALGGNAVIRKYHNSGFAMDFMKDNPKRVEMITLGATALTGILCMILQFGRGRRLGKWGALFIFGGALSNLLDRLNNGYVVDYISLRKGPAKLQKIIFNIADVMITAGGAFILFGSLLSSKK